MIKVNELRIGNLFYDEDKTPCYFAGAWQRQDGWICRDSANNTYKESQMYPIPLTPAMLEKSGRKYTGQDNNWEFEIPVGAIKWYFRWNVEWYSEIGGIYIDSRVLFVHQFQNLYFGFIGKELEIKP